MNNYKKTKRTINVEIEGKLASFEIDGLPLRAEKSVVCKYGDTTVLTTLCLKEVEEVIDFVRLTVFVDEKFYAIGKIPGGFSKRESRPSYNATITARLVDRALRSCFSIKDKKEIQITNTILSVDDDYDLRLVVFWNSFIVSLLSEGLSFDEPISLVVVAEVEGQLVCNPTRAQIKSSPFELIMAASKEKILMLEMFAGALSEEKVRVITEFAFTRIGVVLEEVFAKILSKEQLLTKQALRASSLQTNLVHEKGLLLQIEEFLTKTFASSEVNWDERKHQLERFPKMLSSCYPTLAPTELDELWYSALKKFVTARISNHDRRIDERPATQIRKLDIEVDYLPGVHGSALFSRGNTTVLSVLTLGKANERQAVDDALSRDNSQKAFIHHYNFPDFAVNSLSSFKSTSRREIGHGQLVEKTFSYLVPSSDFFPYTTRIVSEVVSSEGSSSQASICASSLAMMTAGFPLSNHVAGVSLGLFNDTVVTDINDLEDKLGEMDFKIAGTKDGVCSFQMDVKNGGINLTVLAQALEAGRVARLTIIERMNALIAEPRIKLASKLLKCKKIYLGTDKIGLVIGQGGKTINAITAKTGAKIDLQNDGFALLYHHDEIKIAEAYEMIREVVARKERF